VTVFLTTLACVRVVSLALLRDVVKLVRCSSMIKWFMGINTIVPIMVFRLVRTELGLVPIDVEYDRVNSL
jgi:hypothetical protein